MTTRTQLTLGLGTAAIVAAGILYGPRVVATYNPPWQWAGSTATTLFPCPQLPPGPNPYLVWSNPVDFLLYYFRFDSTTRRKTAQVDGHFAGEGGSDHTLMYTLDGTEIPIRSGALCLAGVPLDSFSMKVQKGIVPTQAEWVASKAKQVHAAREAYENGDMRTVYRLVPGLGAAVESWPCYIYAAPYRDAPIEGHPDQTLCSKYDQQNGPRAKPCPSGQTPAQYSASIKASPQWSSGNASRQTLINASCNRTPTPGGQPSPTSPFHTAIPTPPPVCPTCQAVLTCQPSVTRTQTPPAKTPTKINTRDLTRAPGTDPNVKPGRIAFNPVSERWGTP